jgi:hypothetical protein
MPTWTIIIPGKPTVRASALLYCPLRFQLHVQQLPLVWLEGTFLARCWEEEDAVGHFH